MSLDARLQRLWYGPAWHSLPLWPLEWIFRLAVEPHRMWKRYLLGNPAFLSSVMSERQRSAHDA